MITYFQVNGVSYYVDPLANIWGMKTFSPRLTCAAPILKKWTLLLMTICKRPYHAPATRYPCLSWNMAQTISGTRWQI